MNNTSVDSVCSDKQKGNFVVAVIPASEWKKIQDALAKAETRLGGLMIIGGCGLHPDRERLMRFIDSESDRDEY